MSRFAILLAVLVSVCALAPRAFAAELVDSSDTRLSKFRAAQQVAHEDESLARSPDGEMSRFLERYLWFVPQARGHKASLGVGLFLFVSLLLMFAGRLAGLDSASFGRSVGMASGVFSAALLQYAVVPGALPFVMAVVVIDLIAWFAIVRGLFGGDFVAGLIMLVFSSFLLLVFVLSLEVLGFCLNQAGMV